MVFAACTFGAGARHAAGRAPELACLVGARSRNMVQTEAGAAREEAPVACSTTTVRSLPGPRMPGGRLIMACRVGLTTDPERRKREWQEQYRSLRGWRVLKHGLTYGEALRWERHFASPLGCEAHHGGPYQPGPIWCVYTFLYG